MSTPARRQIRPARLYTNAEAAAILRIEPDTLTKKRNGRCGDPGPAVTYVGRYPRYSGQAIAAYLESRVQHGR